MNLDRPPLGPIDYIVFTVLTLIAWAIVASMAVTHWDGTLWLVLTWLVVFTVLCVALARLVLRLTFELNAARRHRRGIKRLRKAIATERAAILTEEAS